MLLVNKSAAIPPAVPPVKRMPVAVALSLPPNHIEAALGTLIETMQPPQPNNPTKTAMISNRVAKGH